MPPSSRRRPAAIWCSRPTPSSAACISFPTTPPTQWRSKALRVNLSDLAAKGARPLGFLLSLALPKDIGERMARRLCRRPAWRCRCCSAVRCSAATPIARRGRSRFRSRCSAACRKAPWCAAPAPSPATAFSSAAPSAMPRSGLPLRKEARDWKLSEPQRQHLVSRYLLPQPRNALAEAVRDARLGGDGCLGRARRRFRQALPRVQGCGRYRGRARAAVGRRAGRDRGRPRRCSRPR